VLAGAQSATPLAAHGAFALPVFMDASLWRAGLPRRLLVATDSGLAEIAMLAGQAGLALHGNTTVGALLPPGTYTGGDAEGNRLYLVTADRRSYRSQLVTVLLTPNGPVVGSVTGFTGVASGVAVAGDRLYVADADRGVRVYDPTPVEPSLLGIVDLEVSP